MHAKRWSERARGAWAWNQELAIVSYFIYHSLLIKLSMKKILSGDWSWSFTDPEKNDEQSTKLVQKALFKFIFSYMFLISSKHDSETSNCPQCVLIFENRKKGLKSINLSSFLLFFILFLLPRKLELTRVRISNLTRRVLEQPWGNWTFSTLFPNVFPPISVQAATFLSQSSESPQPTATQQLHAAVCRLQVAGAVADRGCPTSCCWKWPNACKRQNWPRCGGQWRRHFGVNNNCCCCWSAAHSANMRRKCMTDTRKRSCGSCRYISADRLFLALPIFFKSFES